MKTMAMDFPNHKFQSRIDSLRKGKVQKPTRKIKTGRGGSAAEQIIAMRVLGKA